MFLTVGECRGYSNGVLVSVHYRLGRGSRPSAMVWSLTTVRSVPRNRSFYSIFTASWRGGTPPSAVSPRWASSKVRIPTVHHNHTYTVSGIPRVHPNHTATLYLGRSLCIDNSQFSFWCACLFIDKCYFYLSVV